MHSISDCSYNLYFSIFWNVKDAWIFVSNMGWIISSNLINVFNQQLKIVLWAASIEPFLPTYCAQKFAFSCGHR